MPTTSTIAVEGMTCEHCVHAVRQELLGVPGVVGVDVDLATGAVAIVADTDVDPAVVAAAVDEAGYVVVGP